MRSKAFLLAFTALSLSACGSIMNGSTQTVDVVVKGSANAYCEFTTSRFKNAGTFPNKMTLERSRENLIAKCQGEQNKTTTFEIPSTMTASGTLGNAPTGVIPGITYDASSGGLWTYPDPIIVDFRANPLDKKEVAWPENTADAQVDATRIGTAAIMAPAPVRMQPIQDDQLNPALPATHAPLAKTEVIDAVRLATDKQAAAPAVVKVETTTTTTTATAAPAKITPMKPIISPEDDPAVLKARQEAKAKAAAEAKRKAAEKKKAEEAAAAAAEKAAAEAAEAAKAASDAAAVAAPAATPESAPAETALPEDTTSAPPADAEAPAATEPQAGSSGRYLQSE